MKQKYLRKTRPILTWPPTSEKSMLQSSTTSEINVDDLLTGLNSVVLDPIGSKINSKVKIDPGPVSPTPLGECPWPQKTGTVTNTVGVDFDASRINSSRPDRGGPTANDVCLRVRPASRVVGTHDLTLAEVIKLQCPLGCNIVDAGTAVSCQGRQAASGNIQGRLNRAFWPNDAKGEDSLSGKPLSGCAKGSIHEQIIVSSETSKLPPINESTNSMANLTSTISIDHGVCKQAAKSLSGWTDRGLNQSEKVCNIKTTRCKTNSVSVDLVKNINWATSDIYRAGVIPVYYDGINYWIGLGISKYSGNIITIGGCIEKHDHDLLETAVREFNEEVGNNMSPIEEDELYNQYAIKSEYSITIFLPIQTRPENFKSTDEICDILWVTPKQLKIMANNQEYILEASNQYSGDICFIRRRGKTKAFYFSLDVKLIANEVANFVETGFCTYVDQQYKFCLKQRPKRNNRKENVIVTTGNDAYNSLIQDSKSVRGWGHICMSFRANEICIMRGDGKIYMLLINDNDKYEHIIHIINKIGCKIYLSLTEDMSHPLVKYMIEKSTPVHTVIHTLEKCHASEQLKIDFLVKVHRIRENLFSLISEVKLISEYEEKIYKLAHEKRTFYQEKRVDFLKGLSLVNNLLSNSHNKMLYSKIKNIFCKKYNSRDPPHHRVLNIMIETGLLKIYVGEDNKSILELC